MQPNYTLVLDNGWCYYISHWQTGMTDQLHRGQLKTQKGADNCCHSDDYQCKTDTVWSNIGYLSFNRAQPGSYDSKLSSQKGCFTHINIFMLSSWMECSMVMKDCGRWKPNSDNLSLWIFVLKQYTRHCISWLCIDCIMWRMITVEITLFLFEDVWPLHAGTCRR